MASSPFPFQQFHMAPRSCRSLKNTCISLKPIGGSRLTQLAPEAVKKYLGSRPITLGLNFSRSAKGELVILNGRSDQALLFRGLLLFDPRDCDRKDKH